MINLSFPRALALAVLTASAAFTTGCGMAQPAASVASTERVVVVGVGKLTAKPDIARINLGVETRAAVVADATKQNADQMTRLIDALKAAGVAAKDIRTSNYSIGYERNANDGPPVAPLPLEPLAANRKPLKGSASAATSAPVIAPPAPAGVYRVGNSVQITVRDLARVGAILDTAVSTGANDVHGIGFELEGEQLVEQKLREGAVADAKRRAEALAKLGGVELGEILSISESIGGGGGGPRPMASMAYAKGATPVESGELSFEDRIEVVYAIRHRDD